MTCGGMKLVEEGQSGERGNPLKSQNILCKSVEVDVECMHTKFDGRGLNSFGYFSPFCLPTKCWSKFSFGSYQQN